MRIFFISLLIILISFLVLVSPPDDFMVGELVYVEAGESLGKIATKLKNQNIIRSKPLFETLIIFWNGERKILPGDYIFNERKSVFEVSWLFLNGHRNIQPIKVTIPEGFDVYDIAQVFDARLPSFDQDVFMQKAKIHEGYLFPDTYFFLSTDTEDAVIEYLMKNFEKKVSPIRADIENSLKDEHEIIVMASIIEREAEGDKDRAMISGILWKRIELGMPLQADAAPITYQYAGLPKEPIANPGLASIRAALYPQTSPYLYYLHDREGNIYYGRNFDEHRQNKAKYLR